MTAYGGLVERLLAVVEKGRVDANSIYGDAAVLAYQAAAAIERLAAQDEIHWKTRRTLLAERDALKKDAERLTFLDSQRKWGDCFAVQYLDSGDVYVRPWRYANQSITYSDGRRPHAATVVAQTIREAIDAALAAQETKT